jgi:hypothetical protein
VSPSKIATYYTCPKKYDYIYNQELTPIIAEKATKFDKGNYFHELSHVYYQLIDTGVVPGSDFAVAYMNDRIQKDVQKNKNIDLLPVYAIIAKTISRFIKEQSPIIDRGIKVEGVEKHLVWPINEKIALQGYADLIYRDAAGTLRMRDHKTGERAWTKNEALFSNQLFVYAVMLYKQYNEVPIAEISYINTKETTKPYPADRAFSFPTTTYSSKELDIFYGEICRTIDRMVELEPLPFYGRHCQWCAFQGPCYLSRKGIDTSHILRMHFVHRNSSIKHRPFTEEHSNNVDAD